jgi:hypothetical protein
MFEEIFDLEEVIREREMRLAGGLGFVIEDGFIGGVADFGDEAEAFFAIGDALI